jgi:hypothetical protein
MIMEGEAVSAVDTVSKEEMEKGEPGSCSWNAHHVITPAGEERANALSAQGWTWGRDWGSVPLCCGDFT